MKRILLLSLALPAILNSTAVAQACLGLPSFASGPMQVTGGGSFTDGANSFAGTFGYGRPAGLYGKVGIGTTSYDALDGSSFDVGFAAGYQLPVGQSRKVEACPIASFSLGSGPNDVLGSGADMSNRTFAFGAAFGTSVGQNPRMHILPNASFQFANTKVKIDDPVAGSADASESYGLLTLGTGFVFNSRMSVNPSLSIPIGLDGSDATFGLSAAINFGR